MFNKFKISEDNKKLFTAVSIITGTCIGAGFLGIPYVTAKAGFPITVGYIILFSIILLLVNLYLGEIILRTKKNHQLTGYAEKYLGKKGKRVMVSATKFVIFSAIVAYTIGVGESLSLLIFGHTQYFILIGLFFGLFMSFLIWKGMSLLKLFEKSGVIISLILLFSICFSFLNKINLSNLSYIHINHIFLPFGIILFSMMSFFSIPAAKLVLDGKKKLMKKAIILGTLIPAFFYLIFTFIVVGFMGDQTPEIATFALGGIFIFMGITAMFTSYLSLGNALQQNYIFDFKNSKKKAWFKASIIPIIIFLLTQIFKDFFSFIRVLSLGGVVSGGLIAILILIIHKRAVKLGDRKPEFLLPVNRVIIAVLTLIFASGIFLELFKIY
ncbi:GerAB/ArcD/ProY family transporter [Candidatus Pacearchaeota archaeon]|nr:GerAB/ArcD/ProY family transporter [Candidatus Pacearchaeota archaeon]